MPKELKVTSKSGRTIFRVVFRDLTPEEQEELERQKPLDTTGLALSVLVALILFAVVGYLYNTGFF